MWWRTVENAEYYEQIITLQSNVQDIMVYFKPINV